MKEDQPPSTRLSRLVVRAWNGTKRDYLAGRVSPIIGTCRVAFGLPCSLAIRRFLERKPSSDIDGIACRDCLDQGSPNEADDAPNEADDAPNESSCPFGHPNA